MKKSTASLQGHLLLIHNLSNQYPNSGSLRKSLDKYFNRISKITETDENINVLVSIIIDIAFKNPTTYPVSCAILSKLFTLLSNEKRNVLLELVNRKFEKIPNTSHIKIWLQRITIKENREIAYNDTICDKVNNRDIEIWNSEWLNTDLETLINSTVLINEEEIDKINMVIDSEEFQLFEYQ